MHIYQQGSPDVVNASVSNPPSKWGTYGFAIAIILCLGVGATGVAAYFQIGVLSCIDQIEAIIMMGAGGGGGIILLVIGMMSAAKNRTNDAQQQNDVHTDVANPKKTGPLSPAEQKEIIQSKRDDSVYGPSEWKIWNIEVQDKVPPQPQVDLSQKDKVLFYIPQKIRVNCGEPEDLTLNVLIKTNGHLLDFINRELEAQLGDVAASPGWVLLDRASIPGSTVDYEAQKGIVESRGCTMPTMIEAIVLNLMVFAYTGERLYGDDPWDYTRCIEKVDEGKSVFVGGFGQPKTGDRLIIFCFGEEEIKDCGRFYPVAGAKRIF